MRGPEDRCSLGFLLQASKWQDTGLLMVLPGLALLAVLIVDGISLPLVKLAAAVLSSVVEVLEILEVLEVFEVFEIFEPLLELAEL